MWNQRSSEGVPRIRQVGLKEAILFHHSPEKWESNALDCAIVHVSNALAHVIELGEQHGESRIAPSAIELTQLDLVTLSDLIESAKGYFTETMAVMAPKEKRV